MKEAFKGMGRFTVLTVVAIVIAGAIGAGIWAVGVATSGARGQGDAVRINNSAENWTAKQALFEELYQGVKAAESKVTLQKQALAADPGNLTLQQTLAGVQSHCISQVAAYNAESRKVLSQDWKSPDLPQSLADTNCR